MANILISACGSSIGYEVARALREANYHDTLIGCEVSWWGESLANQLCDRVMRLPRGDDPAYVDAIRETIRREQIDLMFINTEPELEALQPVIADLGIQVSSPTGPHLECCLSKQVLHDKLASCRIPDVEANLTGVGLTAGTRSVHDETDIAAAIEQFGQPVWLRCAVGPRGRGSIPIETVDEGMAWINYWRRRGGEQDVWLCHEYLPGRNMNWTSIWHHGELVVSSLGERLKYFLAPVAISGITGNVSHARLIEDEAANQTAVAAVLALSGKAHGIYSVDLREDRDGIARVTEINARNAFRPLLYVRGGVNFPSIYADLCLRDRRPSHSALDAGTPGWEIIRGMDFEPIFRQVTPNSPS